MRALHCTVRSTTVGGRILPMRSMKVRGKISRTSVDIEGGSQEKRSLSLPHMGGGGGRENGGSRAWGTTMSAFFF